MSEINLHIDQTRAVDAMRELIKQGKRNIILCAPTGSGKTVIGSYLIKAADAKGSRAVFLCDRIALIDQTSETFDLYGIGHGVIQGQHWRWAPHKRIQIASPQTLERRAWPEDLDLIIVDECHTVRADTAEKVARRDCVTIGLTATPFTDELGKLYDAVVSVTTTNKLIEAKRLCPYQIYAPTEIDMEGAKTVAGEWSQGEAGKRGIEVVGDVVENYLKYGQGRKFIAFGSTIAHCKSIRDQLMGAGVRAELYTARTSDSERTEILTEYRKQDSEIRGLVSVAALAKGFDVPSVSCIIIARPLKKSFAEHIQIIGRGLRHDPEDPDKVCVIIDHTGNCVRFWNRMEDFFENSVQELPDESKTKKSAPQEAQENTGGRTCPACKFVHPYAPSCKNCGYVYPVRQVLHGDGEIGEFRAAAVGLEEKQRWYSGLITIVSETKPGSGWAYYLYKDKFGVFPSTALRKTPGPADPQMRGFVQSRRIAFAKRKQREGALR